MWSGDSQTKSTRSYTVKPHNFQTAQTKVRHRRERNATLKTNSACKIYRGSLESRRKVTFKDDTTKTPVEASNFRTYGVMLFSFGSLIKRGRGRGRGSVGERERARLLSNSLCLQ